MDNAVKAIKQLRPTRLLSVLEGFGGPHDYLDSPYWNNANGNNIAYTGFAKGFGYAYSTVNLFVAAPFFVASATPPYLTPVATFNYNRRKW